MGWDADVIMSPAMSLPSQRSCHWPRHCHVISHVNMHGIIAIHVIAKSTATSSAMSSMCDMAIESMTKIILFMTFIFVIENGFGLGFGGQGYFMTVSKCHGSSNL